MYRADPDRGVTDGGATTQLPHLHHSTLSPLHGFNSFANIQDSIMAERSCCGGVRKKGTGQDSNTIKVLKIFLFVSRGYCSEHHFRNVEQHFMAVKQK